MLRNVEGAGTTVKQQSRTILCTVLSKMASVEEAKRKPIRAWQIKRAI